MKNIRSKNRSNKLIKTIAQLNVDTDLLDTLEKQRVSRNEFWSAKAELLEDYLQYLHYTLATSSSDAVRDHKIVDSFISVADVLLKIEQHLSNQ